MEPLLIPAGTTGLAKADFGFRFYADGVADASVVTAITVTEVGSGDYRVSGLPEAGIGTWRTLTWEYPAGAGFSYAYQSQQKATPTNVVIPVREAGLVAADLSLAVYLDGVLRGDTLTAAELGSPGDYSIAGWPTNLAGRWSLVWRRHGLSYHFTWTTPIQLASTYVDERQIVANVLDAFTSGVPILWPDSTMTPPSPGTNPASPVSYLVAEVEHDAAELLDFAGGSRINGRVVISPWAEKEAGDNLVRQHIDTLCTLFAAGDEGGMYFFPPVVGSPLIGGENREWYGREVHIPFMRLT